MFKKTVSLLLIMLLILGMAVGCGNQNEPSGEVAVEEPEETTDVVVEPIIMKLGHAQPTETPRHRSMEEFKKMVEERSNGQIIVEIYPAEQLGNEPELIESVKMGTVQGVRAGKFDDVATELLVYTMPFLFDNVDDFQEVARGEIGKQIAKSSEKNNITILATGDAGGFRHISNNVRPIKTPDDMKGLKIRTPGIESIVKTMEALGSNPVSIPYGETYLALQTGVADGQENPFVNIESMKFHEVQKYLTVVGYQVHPDPFYVNLEWFNGLSQEHQDLLVKASEDMMEISDKLMTEGNEEAFEKIKDSMEVVVLTPEEKEVFRKASEPVYDYFINEMQYFTQELIDEIRGQ